jgi:hypothetical protein
MFEQFAPFIDFEKMENVVVWQDELDAHLIGDEEGKEYPTHVILNKGNNYATGKEEVIIPQGEKDILLLNDRIFLVVQNKAIFEYVPEFQSFILINIAPGENLMKNPVESKSRIYTFEGSIYCQKGENSYKLDLAARLWEKE